MFMEERNIIAHFMLREKLSYFVYVSFKGSRSDTIIDGEKD